MFVLTARIGDVLNSYAQQAGVAKAEEIKQVFLAVTDVKREAILAAVEAAK